VQVATAVEVTLDGGPNGMETQRVVGEDVAAGMRAALARAEREDRRVMAINTVRPTLEDAFVQLTGLSADVMRAEKGGRGR
jgi:hypothetical protein